MFRLDYISCVLTISAAILLGQKRWQGWLIAGINSILICDIAVNTSQMGFIPANVFCVALYAYNIVGWRKQIKAHRELERLSDNMHSRVPPEPLFCPYDPASQIRNRRNLVSRPEIAELRLETFCCERSIPSSLAGHERSPGKHVDLWNLLSCAGNF
jgi:hypothetical protein